MMVRFTLVLSISIPIELYMLILNLKKKFNLYRFNDTVKILPSIWEAAEKAKAARFEHGENGVR